LLENIVIKKKIKVETQKNQDECVIPIHRPDKKEMVFFFSCGIIMSVPITLFFAQYAYQLVTGGLDSLSAALVITTFLAPLIEEFSKIYPLYYRHGETQRSIIYLAIMVGLGFGIVEFISYVLIGVEWYFRLLGLLFHPASTAISAYGIASGKPIPFFMLAVGLHLANNFLAIGNPLPINTSVLIVVLTTFVAWSLYKKAQRKITT